MLAAHTKRTLISENSLTNLVPVKATVSVALQLRQLDTEIAAQSDSFSLYVGLFANSFVQPKLNATLCQ